MTDKKRSAIEAIHYLLRQFPCVAVLGARQVGKTTLLRQLLPNAAWFDLENSADFDRITHDPLFFLSEVEAPVIFDEAQLCPDLFKALRVKIDDNRKRNGQYLISGSSSPELLRSISETLAGRVAIYVLEPFAWEESWQKPISNIYTMLVEQNFDLLKTLTPQFDATQLYTSCLFGGYPEPFLKLKDPLFYDIWMDNYFKTYINRDIRRLFPTLQIETFKRFIRMMAFSSGEIINFSNFARSLDVSQPTAKHYFEIAEGTFLWRSLKTYSKSKKSVIKMPKGHMRDPGIVTHLLNLKTINDLKSHPNYGRLWESAVIEQIIKGMTTTLHSFEPFYYRTKNQAEIDLILEGKFGAIPIEIKSGTQTSPQQLLTLKSFVEENNCPVGIVINQATEVQKLSPTIIQIPASCL